MSVQNIHRPLYSEGVGEGGGRPMCSLSLALGSLAVLISLAADCQLKYELYETVSLACLTFISFQLPTKAFTADLAVATRDF